MYRRQTTRVGKKQIQEQRLWLTKWVIDQVGVVVVVVVITRMRAGKPAQARKQLVHCIRERDIT